MVSPRSASSRERQRDDRPGRVIEQRLLAGGICQELQRPPLADRGHRTGQRLSRQEPPARRGHVLKLYFGAQASEAVTIQASDLTDIEKTLGLPRIEEGRIATLQTKLESGGTPLGPNDKAAAAGGVFSIGDTISITRVSDGRCSPARRSPPTQSSPTLPTRSPILTPVFAQPSERTAFFSDRAANGSDGLGRHRRRSAGKRGARRHPRPPGSTPPPRPARRPR